MNSSLLQFSSTTLSDPGSWWNKFVYEYLSSDFDGIEEFADHSFDATLLVDENSRYYTGIQFKTQKDKMWFLLNYG
jgi:hypothetical protein